MKTVIIIGGGPAGLEAAYNLAQDDFQVCLLEKESEPGGNLKKWVKLFPDFTDADTVRKRLILQATHKLIEIKTNVTISELYVEKEQWKAKDKDGKIYIGDAVLLATGFTPFDASRKEELGYGIYENIITSVDFEQMTRNGKILTAQGTVPKRIAFLNCVGSRDEKVGNHYCSRACCINGVKQAVEVKELIPDCEVYCFYMDLRMSGQCYEELYRKSQQDFGVYYVRGRISEAAGTIDNRIQIKSEDTLAGLPLKITVDMLVLMVGMEASQSTKALCGQNDILADYGFAKSRGLYGDDNLTDKPGLFLAGTCKKPLNIPETLLDARSAATQLVNFLRNKK